MTEMPEAAEVKLTVDRLQALVGSRVLDTGVLSGRYARAPIKNFDTLAGAVLSSVSCRGKCIFFQFTQPELDFDIWAISTLGMTGSWHIFNLRGLNKHKETNHFRFFIGMKSEHDTAILEFHDPRNFGTFKLGWKKAAEKKNLELGPEPMGLFVSSSMRSPFPVVFPRLLEHLGTPAGDLAARAQRFGKRHTVATALLDQRIFCGVGNYVRADACYLAGIDPRQPLLSLDQARLDALFVECGRVCFRAYSNPLAYQSPCYGKMTSPNGNPIESYKDASGRTMWWCPAEQA